MREPPKLADADERARYRRELIAYKRPVRLIGLVFVLGGMLMVSWPWITGKWVMLGSMPMQRAGWYVVAFGCAILAAVVLLRTRYHRKRMRGAV